MPFIAHRVADKTQYCQATLRFYGQLSAGIFVQSLCKPPVRAKSVQTENSGLGLCKLCAREVQPAAVEARPAHGKRHCGECSAGGDSLVFAPPPPRRVPGGGGILPNGRDGGTPVLTKVDFWNCLTVERVRIRQSDYLSQVRFLIRVGRGLLRSLSVCGYSALRKAMRTLFGHRHRR